MSEFYFPSCNFTKESPEAARRLKAYLKEKMPVAGCCRIGSPPCGAGDTALYFCQACRETLEQQNGQFALENLFVWLDRQNDFPWPDYSGLTVNLQDCWRDRAHPEIFRGVRSLLQKMRVRVVDLDENRENSTFCGNLHFEPRKPENIALLRRFPGIPIYELPEDAQRQLMAEQVEKYTCPITITYCNRCTKGVILGGGRGVHLMELVMGTADFS